MNKRITLFVLIPLSAIAILVAVQQHGSGGTQPSQQTTASQTAPVPSSTSTAPLNEEQKAAAIESFITAAQSVPAEFSIDLLIQLVESGEIKEFKRKQDLLVESFYAAAKVKEPLKVIALPGSPVDSRAGYRATAARAGFDALS